MDNNIRTLFAYHDSYIAYRIREVLNLLVFTLVISTPFTLFSRLAVNGAIWTDFANSGLNLLLSGIFLIAGIVNGFKARKAYKLYRTVLENM